MARNANNGETGSEIPNAVGKVASLELSLHGAGTWSSDIKLRCVGRYPLSEEASLRAPSAILTNLRVQRVLNSQGRWRSTY